MLQLAISYRVFEGHEFDCAEWVKVAAGHLLAALQRKGSIVRVENKVDDRHYRQWVVDCGSGV